MGEVGVRTRMAEVPASLRRPREGMAEVAQFSDDGSDRPKAAISASNDEPSSRCIW